MPDVTTIEVQCFELNNTTTVMHDHYNGQNKQHNSQWQAGINNVWIGSHKPYYWEKLFCELGETVGWSLRNEMMGVLGRFCAHCL